MNLANRITMVRIMLIPLLMVVLQPYPQWLADKWTVFHHLNEYGLYYGAVLFLLTAATDKLDGYVARKYNMVTNLGKLLDPLADKLLITVALIMLVHIDLVSSWVAVIIIGREIVITAIRIVASSMGIALAADKLGKLKMVLQVAAITAVLLSGDIGQYLSPLPVDRLLMGAAVLLTIYSGWNYIQMNYKRLQLNL
ncbi:CDP-diacylglycerol--glycerol-3-phosphate 3-phosphatidyltransferase [Paenibacillus kobensis]|uniref:CDP-diacylglycerol--glycerol-3-phosphate 3-phosphatidyltransferase n=1 Tax=Paenibacillus kobensis TaxID=59841 RepID=UPI000FD89E47|nr:CDP-diacylglycerol--glycerol-3-phosphate 3-phosphatidyltransferase [Paenibacillus kobensis]